VQIVPHDRGPALTLGTVAPHELHESKWRLLALRLPPETPVRDVRVLLEGGGSGWLALDRISLAADAESQPEGRPRTGRPHDLRKAMWVWNTKRILADPAETSELLAFCERQRLTDVYCQIPYSYHGGAVTLEGADRLRKFTARAQRAGTRLHALDGAPRFVLPEHHERMFALVEALAAFNREEPENARFQAMHLDNEPYLLREWKNIQTRPEVIRDYVALNRELRRRANAADMEFGIDIPFWFDKQDASGGPVFVLEEGDRSVPLLEALFECAQNVGIMSYRERVTGPNGVVACCMTEFGLGARHGVDVFASLELGTGPDVEKGITFGVYAPEYFDEQQATLQHVLSRQVGCAGMAIHYYDAFRALEVRR
jgi:hypothetical protein